LDELIRRWRKMHIEELHNLYCSPDIIRIIKTWNMGWAGLVARMGRRGIHTVFLWESQKERDHWGEPIRGCKDDIKINHRDIGWGGKDSNELTEGGGLL
jgi:hypothetical protein